MSRSNKIVIPFGWKRQIQNEPCASLSSVTYVSPSGIILSSIAEVCQYLENDTTCKCGLQCPLHVPKVFSFNPEVQSVKKTRKEWIFVENRNNLHKTNCIHWEKLQKTFIDTKTSSDIVCEPPPKLLIIRKEGRLTSVIPDKDNAASGNTGSRKEVVRKKPSVFGDTSEIVESDLSVSARKTSSSLKSPLFEAVSMASAQISKTTDESKSDFKLQWIKADDELSHNDSESENELCFSPDFKKSPPMSFSQLSLPGLVSPPATHVKLEGYQGMMNTTRGHFMQSSHSNMMTSHMGVEPIHRFGMSAFPGTNFISRNNSGIGVNVENQSSCSHQQLPRYPAMSIKSERQSFQSGGIPSAGVRFSHPMNFVRGSSAPDQERLHWNSNQQKSLPANNVKMQNVGGISQVGHRTPMHSINASVRQPVPNQQFPLRSPPPCRQGSPYGVATPGQIMPLSSPGQRTNPSPFSNKSNSSLGTPTPSPLPPGQRQGGRMVYTQDASRPLSRSSNTSTPKTDMIPSPSPIAQWNPGMPGNYSTRTPCSAHSYNPVLSPGPISPPFSPQRFSQSSRFSSNVKQQNLQPSQEHNPSVPIGTKRLPNPHLKQQQVRNMGSTNMQPGTLQLLPPNMNPHFATNLKMQGNFLNQRFVAHETAERSSVSNSYPFSPNMSYRPPRVRYATINEPEQNNMQQGFSMPITNANIYKNPQLGEQPYYRQGIQTHMAWPTGHPRLPTLQNPYQQVVMSHPKSGAPRMQYSSAQQTKPKRKRIRKNSKMKVENSLSMNSNLMTCDLPDFLDPQRHAVTFEKSLPHGSGGDSISDSGTFNHHTLSHRQEPQSLLLQDSSPSLVIPQILQASQASDALDRSSKEHTYNAKQGFEMNASLISTATSKTLVDPAGTCNKQSERNVITPPLPLLSPTLILEETNDNNDFSDFASPSNVFSFPITFSDSKTIAATYLTPSSHSRQEKLKVTGTKPTESVKMCQDLLSKPISHFKPCAVSFSCVKSNSSRVFKSPSFQRSVSNIENTSLVSSSGKAFRMNVPSNKCRRFSDSISVDVHCTPQSDARKRIRSDPFPSISQSCSRELLWRNQSLFQQRGEGTSRYQQSVVPIFTQKESASTIASKSNSNNRIRSELSPMNIHSIDNSQKSSCDSHHSIVRAATSGELNEKSESFAQDESGDGSTNVAPEPTLKKAKEKIENVTLPSCIKAKTDIRTNDLATDLTTSATSVTKISDEKIESEMHVVGSVNPPAASSVALCDHANTKEITVHEPPNSQPVDTDNAAESVFNKFTSNSYEKVQENLRSCQSELPNMEDYAGAKTEVPVLHSDLRSVTSTISKSQQPLNTVSDSLPKSMPPYTAGVSDSCITFSHLPSNESEKHLESGFMNSLSPADEPDQVKVNKVNEEDRNEMGTDLLEADACSETQTEDSVSTQQAQQTDSGGSVSLLDVQQQSLSDNSTASIGIIKTDEPDTVTDTKDREPMLKVLGNENTQTTNEDFQRHSLPDNSATNIGIIKTDESGMITDMKDPKSMLKILGNESTRTSDNRSDEMTDDSAPIERCLKHEDIVEEISKQITDSPKIVKKSDSSDIAMQDIATSECGDNNNLKPWVECKAEPAEVKQSSIIECSGSGASDNTSATSCTSDTLETCPDNVMIEKNGKDKNEAEINSSSSENDCLNLDNCESIKAEENGGSSSCGNKIDSDEKSECTSVADKVIETNGVAGNSIVKEIHSSETEERGSKEDATKLNASQLEESVKLSTTSSINVGLSPELTDTVIRQLSNYNTILKNLLVSGVGPVNTAALAQLTAGSVVSDEHKAKMLSALLANNFKMDMRQLPTMLLKDSILSGSDLAGSSSRSVDISTNQVGAEATNVPSSSFSDLINRIDQSRLADDAQRISNYELHSRGEQSSLPKLLDASVVDSSEVDDQMVVDKTPPADINTASLCNQGLQVPIVSSSVKGTHHDDIGENDHELKDASAVDAKTDSVDTGSKSVHVVMDEVSTSIKDVDSSEVSSNKDAICTGGINTGGPRRGRTRNSAGKLRNTSGNLKRSSGETPAEKSQKRSSATTSVQMPSNLRPIHRPSEKQTRVFKSGDLVWGQMRGYPSWPGKIVKPSEVRSLQQRAPLSDGKAWVKWFGDHTFTQMNPADLRTMTEGLEAHHKSRMKGRTRNRKISIHLETAIQEAVDELEQQQELKQGNVKKISNVAAAAIAEPQATDVIEQSKKRRCKRKKR